MSKATDIWMPLYIGDYLSATQHLSTEQNGAYLLLLMSAWKFGGKLPDDDEQLASIAKMPLDRWIKTRQVICRFFEISSGFWTQKRLSEEIQKASDRKRVSSENGRHGGRPRTRQVIAGIPAGNPERNLQESTSPSPSPSPIGEITHTTENFELGTIPYAYRVLAPISKKNFGDPKTQRDEKRFRDHMETLARIKATPEQLEGRIEWYRKNWPNVVCTLQAVLSNWDTIAAQAKPMQRKANVPNL